MSPTTAVGRMDMTHNPPVVRVETRARRSRRGRWYRSVKGNCFSADFRLVTVRSWVNITGNTTLKQESLAVPSLPTPIFREWRCWTDLCVSTSFVDIQRDSQGSFLESSRVSLLRFAPAFILSDLTGKLMRKSFLSSFEEYDLKQKLLWLFRNPKMSRRIDLSQEVASALEARYLYQHYGITPETDVGSLVYRYFEIMNRVAEVRDEVQTSASNSEYSESPPTRVARTPGERAKAAAFGLM